MTDEVTPQAPEEPTAGVEQPEQEQAQPDKTFTQDELDRILKDRLAKERKKYEGYSDLQKKAEEYDKLVEAQKTEEQKLRERLEALEAENQKLELMRLQRQAADKHGLPPEFATRLQGKTLEELEADAELVAKLLPKKATQTVANPGDNASGKGETEDQQRARVYGWNRNIFDPAEIEKRGGGVHWVEK